MGASRDELSRLSSDIDNLFDLGKSAEGTALLEKALTDSAQDEAYHLFFSAEAAGYLGRDSAKQKKLLLQAHQLAAADPFIVKNVGVYFLINDSERTAIKFFDQAIALDPLDFESLRHKGLAFSNLGRENKGMEWFAKALEINPLDYDSMRQTGVSLSKLDKNLEAIAWFRKALSVNENDYDSIRQLGISLAMIGKYDAAVECLNLALAVNPNDFESKRNMRLVLKKMSGEGETILSRFLNYLGRKLSSGWRWLANQM